MLKQITLNGFKSFSKKTELTFTSPITCIVGPNGSGKSNVAEAFKWVLGEQSMKSLRGKRGEDLIFNGTRNTPRSNRALVSLYFDNRDNIFNIDFDEVHITREVFRDGGNRYLLNDSQVRLKDIIELLSNVSLGASSHHIINQGEADKILNASAKERRAMVEDALGLRVYHWKAQEAERKLERTDANLKETESLRREISGHLRFLKKEVEKIEKSESLRKNLVSMYEEYFSIERAYLLDSEKYISKQKEIPESRLKEIEKDIKDIESKKEKSSTEKDYGKTSRLEEDLKKTREEKDDLTRKLGRVEGMIEIKINEKKQKENINSNISIEDVNEWTNSLILSIEEAEKSEDVGRIKDILLSLKRRIKNFFNEIKKDENDDSENENLNSLEKEKKEILASISKSTDCENDIKNKIDSINKEIESKSKEERVEERSLFEKREERGKLLGQIETILVKYEKFNFEKENFSRELNEARILVDFNEGKINTNNISDDKYLEREEQEKRRREIHKNKVRLEDIGPFNEDIVNEYKEVTDRDMFLSCQIEDLTKTKKSLEELIEELVNNLDKEFEKGINKINKEFSRFFSLMFDGGDASIRAFNEKAGKKSDIDIQMDEVEEDSVEEEISGIEIKVNLPRKRIKSLEMLSGGERALTSIALLFAMSQVNPPPFLILDETDAALDEANSKKYGDMIESLSKRSQLILVTHNRETMSRAGVLYGVTMGSDGVSKLLSVRFDEAVAIAK